MKLTSRGVHRDLGYFYIGLIISFSISGVMLNHRKAWNPTKYVYEEREISYDRNLNTDSREELEKFVENLGIDDVFRRSNVEGEILRISLVENDVTLNLRSGQGEVVTYRKTPLVYHSYTLHWSTSEWWIYYSDIFGLSLLTIAITGLYMFPKGNQASFRKRGWKLAAAGIIFPLLFLFILA